MPLLQLGAGRGKAKRDADMTRRGTTAALAFRDIDIDERGKPNVSRFYRERPASEAQVLHAVLDLLARHPKIAWRRRINSGFQMIKDANGAERPFRSGFVGCSDIIAQTKAQWGGRFVAVECKSSSGVVTEAQEAFLETVRAAGGIALVARSIDDVLKAIPL